MLYCSQKKENCTVFRRREQVHNCSQKKKLVLHCSQENGYSALLFTGKRNRCTTVLKEKETGALLFSLEGKRCSTVFKIIKQGHYCYQEQETGALLFSG